MIDRIGAKVMLGYLQSWGQSAEKRIATLNEAVAAAGIKAEFRQGPNGENAGWHAEDQRHADLAVEFRQLLGRVWCGEFNEECRNVEALIADFKKKAEALPA